MNATVVINPIAGPGRSRTLDACAALASTSLGRAGFQVDVRITTAPDDAQRFAAAAVAAGHQLVAAWGGDGTVNGVGAALAGTPAALAIIPGGSGNGLARDLGVPLDAASAFDVAGAGTNRLIDAGELDGTLFFNVAGIGLDASIASRMAAPGARRGLLGYVIATLSELAVYRPREYAIAFPSADALPIHASVLFVALANSRQYGNGAQIAPHALLDDGKLDIVVVRPLSLVGVVARVPAFFNGTLKADDKVLMRTSAEATITSNQDIWYHVDGEPRRGGQTVVLRTLPRTLAVRVRR